MDISHLKHLTFGTNLDLEKQFNLNHRQVKLLSHFLSRTGQVCTISTSSKKNGVTREMTFQAQAGVEYDKMKVVKEGRENGKLPAKNAGLPYGEWIIFKYLILHKGELYLRFSNPHKPLSKKHFWCGQEISNKDGRLMRKDPIRKGPNTLANVPLSTLENLV